MNSFQLPAHHAINRYFREQRDNSDRLTEFLSGEAHQQWVDAYRCRKVPDDKLSEFTDSLDAVLRCAGAFNINRDSQKATKPLPNRGFERIAACYFDPVTLGEGFHSDDQNPYIEHALLLNVAKAEFRLKRGRLGLGFAGLVLTQHMLSRVYERTEIGHTELGPLINSHAADLLAGLGLAEAMGLWTGTGGARATAIPFANGLMLVNSRLLLGNISEGDFGFHIRFPNFSKHTPFVNHSLIADPENKWGEADLQPVLSLCGTTYLNLSTLNEDQSDYYFHFEALKGDLGQSALNALSFHYFSPNLAHERSEPIILGNDAFPKRAKVLALLKTGWLKADKPSYAALFPFEGVAVQANSTR